MTTHRRPGTRPANPDQLIRLTLGFAASEADSEIVERLTVAMGAQAPTPPPAKTTPGDYANMPWSQVVEHGVNNLLPSAWNSVKSVPSAI